jgi:amicyanin
MRRLVLSLAASGLLVLAACGSSSGSGSTTTTTGAPATGSASVDIKNFEYLPPTVAVKTGTVVTWTNSDAAPHTVTAEDKSFDSGGMSKDQTYKHTFDKPGTFKYICTYHSNMHGTVVVTS